MENEIDVAIVLTSLREQIGTMAQEKAILVARIARLEEQLKKE